MGPEQIWGLFQVPEILANATGNDVGMVVLGGWLDLIVLEVFSNL